jgi:hypothetical protein
MMTYDIMCLELADHFLADYELSPEEYEQESVRLAEFIQRCVESELENLEHRKRVTP